MPYTDKELGKIAKRLYYRENRGKILAERAEYREKNSDYLKEKSAIKRSIPKEKEKAKKYRKENPEKFAIYKSNYYQNNAEKLRQYSRDYGKENRYYIAEQVFNRVSLKRIEEANVKATVKIHLDTLLEIYEWGYENELCIYCGNLANCIDHFLPIAKGGLHTETNLVSCCSYCNGRKNDIVFQTVQDARNYILNSPTQ